ncbi:MAG: cadmium-translocating P-type ATPase [Mogibacterium sp.]|nr:cadmium-translocating P-type ATPase [Mogibacterium sp.]MBQ6502097.1 cadmium-translocating P-type ATPase [Mogibacterium sp.]
MDRFTSKQKKELKEIGISFVLFVTLMAAEHTGLFPDTTTGTAVQLLLYMVPYFIVGHDVVRKCLIGIKNRQLFDESFLMTLATIGAFGCKEFGEAVAVMLFYQVGEFFQGYAVGKSRGSIADLMSMAPDFANREAEDGSLEVIDPDDIEVGDILVIKPGEKVPTDGVVIEGRGYVNTSALTGESLPRPVSEGEQVISGCINGETLLRVRAEKEFDDCTVSQILELVEEASSRKSVTENFITRFAHYYTPAVVIAAVVLAFLPPLVSGHFAAEFGKWVLRACTFLVISCPCALVISVPLAFFGGIGAASSKGVLVKGSNYLELLADLDTVVSDKTGTLTEGRFRVAMVEAAEGHDTDEIIRYAAAAEAGSTHPIAAAITEACEKPIAQSKIKDVKNVAGKGITAKAGRDTITVGNRGFFDEEGIDLPEMTAEVSGTNCYVARNGKYIGTIIVADVPKKGAKEAISEMLRAGVRSVIMLTGDSEKVASAVAAELGITEYKAELLPQDKVSVVEELLEGLRRRSGTGENADKKRGRLAFIGDGINDAPVLSVADVGIAMGSLGSDAAIEAADIVIMDDELGRIPAVMGIARKTLGISRQNIAFALLVKFGCLILGALGIANMWVAVFADVGVAVICILNSMRMLKK